MEDLNSLPGSKTPHDNLVVVYNRLLERALAVGDVTRPQLSLAIFLLLFGHGKITTKELNGVQVVPLESDTAKQLRVVSKRVRPLLSDAVQIALGCFATSQDGIIKLAHHSVRTFFLSGECTDVSFRFNEQSLVRGLPVVCLDYVVQVLDDERRPSSQRGETDRDTAQTVLRSDPLLSYLCRGCDIIMLPKSGHSWDAGMSDWLRSSVRWAERSCSARRLMSLKAADNRYLASTWFFRYCQFERQWLARCRLGQDPFTGLTRAEDFARARHLATSDRWQRASEWCFEQLTGSRRKLVLFDVSSNLKMRPR